MADAAGRVSDNAQGLIEANTAINERGAAYRWVSAVDQITGFNNAMAFQGFALVSSGGFHGHDADTRAESLLRSWLSPQQLEDWVATRNFIVQGGSTGRSYRVGDGCYELGDDGQNVAYLCFGPIDYSLPSADRVLAKKLALQCDEETVLRVANRAPAIHGAFTFGLELAQQQALANQQQSAVNPFALVNAACQRQMRAEVAVMQARQWPRTAVAQPMDNQPCTDAPYVTDPHDARVVVSTERMSNLVQAAARELQERERQWRRAWWIVRGLWAVVALVGIAWMLAVIFD